MSNGWLKLHRKALDNPELREPDAFRFWFWLLANASHKPHRVYRGKGGRAIDLQPGQLVVSTANGLDGLSRKRVRTLLDRFSKFDMISVESRRDIGHTIAITKWQQYQHDDGDFEGAGAIQGAKHGPYNGQTTAKQRPTAQEGKEGKEGKEEDSDSSLRSESGAPSGAEAPTGPPPDPEPPPKAKPKAETRGTFVDPEWRPTDADRDYAHTKFRWPDARIDLEADKFRDHYLKATGPRSRCRSWAAAWRNWVQRADEWGGPSSAAAHQGNGRAGGHMAPRSSDGFAAAAARVAARRSGLPERDDRNPVEVLDPWERH